MASKIAVAPRNVSGEAMRKLSVGLVLTFSGIGNRRKVDTSEIEVDADKELIAVSKKLLDSPELDEISSLDGKARQYIETTALPSMLKRGVYLMPIALIEEADKRLNSFAERRHELVETLCHVLQTRIEEAKRRLKGLFEPNDYPRRRDIREQFQLTWQWIEFDTPTALKEVSRSLYEKERRKSEKMWDEMRDQIQEMLRLDLAELVDHLGEKLQPDDSGKPKVFRDSAVTKIQDFLATFDARNITGDVELRALVNRTRALIEDVDADRLRKSRSVRNTVGQGFDEISKAFDAMITVKPKRAIRLA